MYIELFVVSHYNGWGNESGQEEDEGYWKLMITQVSELLFADDIAILVDSEENLKHNLNTF